MADWLKLEVKNGDEGEDAEFELGEEDLQKAYADDDANLNLNEQEQKEIQEELK